MASSKGRGPPSQVKGKGGSGGSSTGGSSSSGSGQETLGAFFSMEKVQYKRESGDPHDRWYTVNRDIITAEYKYNKDGLPSGTWPFDSVWIRPKDPILSRSSPYKEVIELIYRKPLLAYFPEFLCPEEFPNGRPECPNPKCDQGTKWVTLHGHFHKKMIHCTGARMFGKR